MENFEEIRALFAPLSTAEMRYEKIIELGSSLDSFPENQKVPKNIVHGCQSIVYVHAELNENLIYFYAYSDALISAGLASLLLLAYSGKSPEFILKTPPSFLQELEIISSLTPGRSNGVASMYLHMKKSALNFLLPA